MVWFSYHGGHSGEFCGHAKGQLANVVQAAMERGFTTYGLSEHAPRWRREHLFAEEAALEPADLMRLFERYTLEARALVQRHAGRLELLVGFETEALPVESWVEKMRGLRQAGGFDYIVGSVHSIGDLWLDYKPEMAEQAALAAGGWEPLREVYFERLAELVSALRPEVVGHVDLVRRFEEPAFEFSPRALAAAERVLAAALSVGAAIEVNAAPARRGFGPVYPGPQVLARARRMGVPVTLGDDSHGPETVGVGLDECLAAIARAGYREVHYLTRRDGLVTLVSAPLDEVKPNI